MDVCNSQRCSFSGCDDYLTYSLHLDCQEGNLEDFKQKIRSSQYDFEGESFYSGYTLLQTAAINNRLDIFQWLFDCSSSGYYSLAYFGSIAGHGKAILESMKYFQGINLKSIHYIATTCGPGVLIKQHASLVLACLDGNLKGVIKTKWSHTVSLDNVGHTALHLACLNENLDVIKCLLERFYNKDCQNILRNTPLHLSCIQGNIDLVKYLVNERGCNLLIENINGHTPLHVACQYGNIVVVKYLIDVLKADTLFQDSRGNTLLHHASHVMGDIEVAEYLVDIMHCDPFYPNNEKSTPIHLACRNGNLEIAKYLSSATYHYQISCVDKRGRTPLHEACIHGHLNIVSHLTHENHSMHKDINCSDYYGFTPLHLACKHGLLDIVMYLINKCKCDVSYTDDDKHTPLHLACKHGHLDIVMYLINECKCDVSYTVDDKHTPLHLACKHGHLDIVMYLVNECKCDVSYTDDDKHTPLHLAYKHRHFDIVMYLINECKCDVSFNPLHLPFKLGHLDIVKYLIDECKCDVSYTDDDKHILLHLACKHGLLDIVMYLINKCKCDVSYTNDDKQTPLHLACKHGHLDIVMYLINECKCDVSYTDDDKHTPLHLACKHGHLDIMMYLVNECKCDVSYTDDDKLTPLHLACKHRHFDIVMYLINECKCNVSFTPLHLPCKLGHLDIVKYLIDECKCDVSYTDDDKNILLHLACKHGHLDIVTYLINEDGKHTPLHLACKHGHLDIVTYLINEDGKHTPLYLACKHGHLDIVMYLIKECKRDIPYNDDDRHILLHLACKHGHLDIVTYLINEYKCDVSYTDDDKHTPLHLACQNGYVDIVNYLINNTNCNITSVDKDGLTPCHIACSHKYFDIAVCLLNKMKSTNDKYQSLLHIICQNGHFDLVKFLIKNLKNSEGCINFSILQDTFFSYRYTPLHYANECHYFDIVQYLVSMIYSVLQCQNFHKDTTFDLAGHQDNDGNTLLHFACLYGQIDYVKSSIKKKYFNQFLNKNNIGLTPLHFACIGGNFEIIQYLVTDETPSSTDYKGCTLLHYASQFATLKVVKFVTKKYISDLLCCNLDNNTALHLAVRYDRVVVVKYFLEEKIFEGNLKGENGKTPLILAAFYQSYETLKYLITDYSKCDHSITDNNGKTAFCYINEQDREDIINFYVDSTNYEITGKSYMTRALLYASAEKGQFMEFEHICNSMKNKSEMLIQHKLSHETDNKGNTALHLACMFGNLKVVQYLASEIKLNLDILNFDGQTCSHLASKHGQFLVVQYLSSINANISCKDKNGSTPLHIACQYGYLNIVELLSTTDSESVLDADGRNPLHIASYYGQLQIVQSFLNDSDFDSFCEDPLGLSPLHHACIGDNLEVVQFLDTDNIPATDNTGYTPLHHACKHGNLKIVQYFTSKDQSKLFYQDHNNNTPLHIAARYNQSEVVQYFMEQNLYDVNLRGENEKTPLLIAASYNCDKTLDYLFHSSLKCDPLIEDSSGKSSFLYMYLNGRSDIVSSIIRRFKYNIVCTSYETEVFLYLAAEQKHQSFKHILHNFSNKHNILWQRTDDMGNTALHIASKFGCLEIVQYIVDEINFPSNHHNIYNQTCIHLASKYGQLPLVKYLTKNNKCDPLSIDNYGSTPLHYAAKHGCLSVVKYFIEEVKVSTEIMDAQENTPLHLASTKGHKEIVDCLVTNSSNLLVRNIDGNTPLHLACHDGHYEVFKILLTTTKYDIHSRNILGKSIVDYAQDKPDMAQTIRGVYGVEATFIPKIFVIGFSGAGKSTLVSALQKEASFLGRYLSIPKVPPHTVGVTPVKFQSSSYGTVKLYDFAGHEEYHANHQLLFQSSYLPIVLLLINLNMEEENIISSIKYWVNILKNSLTSKTGINQSATVILLASHYDQIRGNRQEKIYNLEVKIEKTLSKLESEDIEYNRGLLCLDCRKPSCHGIETLRSLITSSCLACRAKIAKQFPFETSLICQEILNFLSKNVSFKLACTISDICEMARKERLIPDIVKSNEEMFEMCSTLGFYGKIVLLTDSIHREESWIILNEKYILSEFHKSMHLLQSQSEQSFSNQVACGLVSISQLHQLFPNNLDLILKYLQHSQICMEIETVIPQSLLKERFVFFPYLTKENKPELFTLQSTEEMSPFYCWQLVCHDPFTPRFLQVLLVQLTVPVPGAGDVVPPNYNVWKNGIHITNNDTTESIIEVNSSASQLLFAIRCQKNNKSSLLTRRSHLIDLIFSVLTKNCPLITYEEFLFQPQNFYPIKSPAKKCLLKKAAGALIEGRPTVFTYDGTQCLELAAVLCSDPVLHVNPILLKRIYLHSNDVIPPPTMEKLCMQGNIMSTWNSSNELTYKQLQERLSFYSVFFRRNIWDIADCELKPLPIFLMKYKIQLDSIELYITAYNPLTIRLKEGESCNIPFTEQSNEDYCYGHILSKEGQTLEQEVERFVMFNNVNKDDSGVYVLCPKHNGWNGLMQIKLNVEFAPQYSFIEENKSIISITEGSTKEIKFTATANPPLTDDTKHELTCVNGGVEVPATRRFTVYHNTIILTDITPEDTGLYQISCKGGNGQVGKEVFELKILCMPKYTLSKTSLEVTEGSNQEMTFSVSSNPPLPSDTKHEICLLKEQDMQVPAPGTFIISQNTMTISNVRCEDSGTYQISCKNVDGVVGKEIFKLTVTIAPVYKFTEESKSLISVPEGSTKQIKFTVSANPPLSDDTKHELTCLNSGVEVPATRRFTVYHNTIILTDITPEDTGLYQISCKGGNGQIVKEVFELKILCMPKYTLSKTSLEVTEGSNQEMTFSVSSNPPLPGDAKHEICLLKEQDMQVPVPGTFIISQNTITMSNVKCEDSGTYQISCKNVDGIIGKDIFKLTVTTQSQSVTLPIEQDSKEVQLLKNNWKKMLIAMTFDTIWLAGEMNRIGLLSDYDHLDVTTAKSLLNETDKAVTLMTSLKKKVALDSKHLNTFVDILKTKASMYSDVLVIFEGLEPGKMCHSDI